MSDQRSLYTIVSPGWGPQVVLAGVRGRPGSMIVSAGVDSDGRLVITLDDGTQVITDPINRPWGSIQGDITDQSDLMGLLADKVDGGTFEQFQQGMTQALSEKLAIAVYNQFVLDVADALAGKVGDDDPRLSDSRTPTGGAGGVLSGQYPNPGFAVDMATQAELGAVAGSKVDKVAGMGLSSNDFTDPLRDKLDGIAAGATANSTDAYLLNRANHTGTQAISTVAGLQTSLDSKLGVSEYTASDVLEKLKTVDGVGSGLDADLLDGLHSSDLVLRNSDTPIGYNTLNYVAGTAQTNNGGFRVGLGGMQAVRLNDSPTGKQWGVAIHMNAFYRPVDGVYGYTAPNQYIPLVSLEIRNGGVLLKTHPQTGGTGNAHVPQEEMTTKSLWDSSDFTLADINSWNTAYGWGNHANAGYLTTDNIQSTTGQSTVYPMTQKAVTDAINARGFADASGILTETSGALSNDMSSFLSSLTFAEMRGDLGLGTAAMRADDYFATAEQVGDISAALDAINGEVI